MIAWSRVFWRASNAVCGVARIRELLLVLSGHFETHTNRIGAIIARQLAGRKPASDRNETTLPERRPGTE